MKKLLLILLTTLFVNHTSLQSMQTMQTLIGLTSNMYDYFKTCDVKTTLLVATVGLLVVDRFYPIFSQKKQVQHVEMKADQTYIEGIVDKKLASFSEDTFNPAIQALGERIAKLPQFDITALEKYVTLEAFNEKVLFFGRENEGTQKYLKDHDLSSEVERISKALEALTKPPRLQLPLPKNSLEMYSVVNNEDIREFIYRKLTKMKKKTERFKEICLRSISSNDEHFEGFNYNIFTKGCSTPRIGEYNYKQQAGTKSMPSTPRYMSDEEFNNNPLDFILEEGEEDRNGEKEVKKGQPVIPTLDLNNINLGSSASLQGDATSQYSPLSPSTTYLHIPN